MRTNFEGTLVKICFSLQLETIKSGSPIAKTTTQSEQNLLQANLYKEGDLKSP